MTAPDRERFARELIDWLNRRMAPPGVEIGPDTPLFEDGMIESLRMLELIAWTEVAIGAPIPDTMIRMDNFHSAARVAEVFNREGSDAGS